MPAYAKDAGWQWYTEKLKSREEEHAEEARDVLLSELAANE